MVGSIEVHSAEGKQMTWLRILTQPETAVFVVMVAAIVVFGAVTIIKTLIRHRERMAMIEQGMHPDIDQLEQEPEETTAA